jgi:hypothetical protein
MVNGRVFSSRDFFSIGGGGEEELFKEIGVFVEVFLLN